MTGTNGTCELVDKWICHQYCLIVFTASGQNYCGCDPASVG